MTTPHEHADTLSTVLAQPGGQRFVDSIWQAVDDFQRAGFPPPEQMTGTEAKAMADRVDLILSALNGLFGCPCRRRTITLRQLASLRPATMNQPLGEAARQCLPLAFRRKVEGA